METMEQLKEQVCDAGNVVTCRKVGVHALEQLLQNEENLGKSHFVSGLVDGVRVATVLTCRPDVLPTKIISDHVYSVAKKAHPSGLLPIEFDVKKYTPRMIKCRMIVSRTSEDMDRVRFKASSIQKASANSIQVKKLDLVKKEECKNHTDGNSMQSTKKPVNNKMASFFSSNSKQDQSKTTTKTVNKNIENKAATNGSVEKSKTNEIAKQSPKENMAATNGSVEKSKTNEIAKQSPKENKAAAKSMFEKSKTNEIAKELTKDSDSKQEKAALNTKFNNIRTYEKKKSTPNSKATVKKGEKRKRIRVIDSDDSDSENDPFASSPEDNLDNIHSDDENVIPPTPEASEKPKIRVVMKTVKKDKVFMGDDDYIHTVRNVCENVTEIETSNYADEVIKAKSPKKVEEKTKPEAKKSKKTSPKTGAKQGNIMSYFSKKPT